MDKPETICWNCKNVGKRLCPWDDSKGSEPTPGWTAIPQTLHLDRKRVGTSYIVLECPLADLEEDGS